MIADLIKEKSISVYSLAKGANVPYTTVNEIVLGKKNIMDCSIKTIMAIANYLGYQTDDFIRLVTSTSPKLSTSWLDNKEKSFVFPLISANSFYDARLIHPLKQKIINELYKHICINSSISKVILFGSSINIRCKADSDIDLAINLKDDKNNLDTKNEVSELIQEVCGYKADIIWLNGLSKNSKIYNNISKGVVIYE